MGCYAWSPDKVGCDIGELCGLERLGVTATDDVDALLALQPDCVVYNPMWPSIDELVRILGAGVNVVSQTPATTMLSSSTNPGLIPRAEKRGAAPLARLDQSRAIRAPPPAG